MMDEHDFHRRWDAASQSLQKRLAVLGDAHGFEVEGASGKLEILFDDAEESRFILSPNTPVRQIWISALSTSFKLAWSDERQAFILDKTGETLDELLGRILTQQLGTPVNVV
jgi:iron donor protein CyaY